MNGRATTSMEVSSFPGTFSGGIISRTLPGELKPRFTNPKAICRFNLALWVALVIQPASLPPSGARSCAPTVIGPPSRASKPHKRLFVWPDIFIREITS